MNTFFNYNPNLKHYARVLRNHMTYAERRLWYKIRNRQLHGIQFCRQLRIESYIIDFYAKQHKIAIEIDGPIHLSPRAIAKDRNRDYVLRSLGIKVLRFSNGDVTTNIDRVLKIISNTILNFPPL